MTDIEHLTNIGKTVRHHILTSTTAAQSGHPTSSLSAVELMVYLYFSGLLNYDLSQPNLASNDRVIFSKGHAAPLFYALLTVAGEIQVEELATLRQWGSRLEGHPTRLLEHTEAATGSLGQGLSIGLGMALHARAKQSNSQTYVLLGDSELAEGSNWEAIQLASYYDTTNLVGILDVNRLGQRGPTMYHHDLHNYASKLSSFGWEPILLTDGHDFAAIATAFDQTINSTRPSMIIAQTIKGKGVPKWENAEGFHSKQLKSHQLDQTLTQLGEVDPQLQASVSTPPKGTVESSPVQAEPPQLTIEFDQAKPITPKLAFGQALMALGKQLPEVVVLDAEVSNSTHTDLFQDSFPNRFFEMFVAEQNMVGTAVGMARRGALPVVSSFAAFLSRAYDQIRMAQYSRVPMIIAGSYAGSSLGKDGSSQMGLEDIAFMRSLHNSIVLAPSDAVSAAKLTALTTTHPGISYLRLTREPVPVLYSNQDTFTIASSHTLVSSQHDQVTIFASGICVHEALAAGSVLAQRDIRCRIIDMYSILPIDAATILLAADQTEVLISVEDHSIRGGLGEAVAGVLAQTATSTPLHILGVDQEPHSGSPAKVMNELKIDRQAIIETITHMLNST